MNLYACEKCNAPLALAENTCQACGAPAPKGRAAKAASDKAEAAFARGDVAEAARQLQRALEAGLEPAGPGWRKLGVWQEKLGQDLPAAVSFRKALDADFSDELAHQLSIANLGRQGRMAEALAFYQSRLDKDPGDAMAARQLGVAKLSADFKSQAPPKGLDIAPTKVEGWLKPTPRKVALIGANAVLALLLMLKAIIAPPLPPSELDGQITLFSIFSDPWTFAFQASLSVLALAIMYWSRR